MKTELILNEDALPREKIQTLGVHSLTDHELITVLLGSGTAKFNVLEVASLLLSYYQNDLHTLAKSSYSELQKVEGIGPAKSLQLCASFELGRRSYTRIAKDKTRIKTSRDAYIVVRYNLLNLHHEEFWLICLNRSNKVIGKWRISSGGISGTIADPKMIFEKALSVKASGIIVAHNHPSGNLQPSSADIKITKQLRSAGEFLDLPILDHLILTDFGYYSFADENLL